MATPKIIADFESQLATAIAVGGTTFSLSSATDDDGVALPTGLYYFTVDNGSSNKEYLAGTLSGTSVTGVVSVSRQGVETSGAARAHRVGASVIITDFATYMVYMNEIALVSAPDASISAKGVVEMATTAEVDAGTAVGGTLAALAVAPDKLAASIYATRLPSAAEKAALVGDGGTPSASIPYVLKAKSMTAGATINGGTLPVPVYQNKTDNEFYACDGNDTGALKFVGFAISNGTDGAAMTVQFNGVVSGFSGLDEGEKYYLSDTVGTISTTPGTYEVKVGRAISTTQLLIEKGIRRASGNGGSLGTASGSLAVTTGFRPSVVRLAAAAGGTTYHSVMSASYINGAITGTASHYNEGSSTAIANSGRLYGDADSNYMEFTITSVTDTGFTITWTETGAFNPTASAFSWDAEGEV